MKEIVARIYCMYTYALDDDVTIGARDTTDVTRGISGTYEDWDVTTTFARQMLLPVAVSQRTFRADIRYI